MSTHTTKSSTRLAIRVAVSLTLAVSGLIHGYLYVHGYRFVPTVGPAFLLQASIFGALAILILAGGPAWLSWASGALSVASLAAFALSRTVGLLGFIEHGWEPPYGPLTVVAELLTAALVAATVISSRQKPRA